MSNETKSLPVHEMDTNILFEKYTVDEIRNIEKQTRSDIERKKEDLRTMVGERYRDLIEAADTITEMKNSSQKVMGTIGKIETLCSDLKQSHMIKGSNLHHRRKQEMDSKKREEARFYGVASQIKLLLDIPEKIWTCLDFEDYLTASRLYLLSQHINTSLHLDSQNAPNFLYWFPVLNRQWAAISHFKFTILQGCRRLLKEPAVPDKKIAESLCSILLLENSNPRQVFNEFLLARTEAELRENEKKFLAFLTMDSAIQQLFNTNNPSGSTKDQICVVTQLITTTIHQIHSVFYTQDGDSKEENENTNLLLRILNKVTTEKQCDTDIVDLQNSVSAKCLPKSVSEFCPSHKSMSMGVSEQHRHDNCQQWIQTCTSDVKAGVSKLLNFVNSVKHLSTIRDTVWELMSKDSSLENWDKICERVLNKSLHIWDDLLRPLFVDRVQALIKYQIETSVELTERQISTVFGQLENITEDGYVVIVDKLYNKLEENIEAKEEIADDQQFLLLPQYFLCYILYKLERQISTVFGQLENITEDGSLMTEVDLASYIWSESPNDIAAARAWGSGSSKPLFESGGLMMKARALTPVVQSLCKHFDEKLKLMNEDCLTYIFSDVENLIVTMDTTPFNRYADSAGLMTFTQDTCVAGIKGMIQFLTELSNECKEAVKEAVERCHKTGNKLLLIGRLCSGLCDLTPHLQQSMLGSDQIKQDRMKRSVSGRLSAKGEINTVWEESKTSLVQFQFVVYRVWVDHIVEIAGKRFSAAVNSENPCDLIKICDRWDEVSIEEETEDGKKITSKISVPMQASSYLLSLLYGLCNDLNYIGGHSVQRRVLEHLVYSMSDKLAYVYTQLLSTHKSNTSTLHILNQHRAIQTLFDVKFLLLIIPRKDDTKESKKYQTKVNKVISDLEEMIDPFDLDVFFPYIQSNLSKLAQRSSVLLGGLTSIDKSSFYSMVSRPSTSTQQEQHNVLLLSTCNSRFSLLPLSIQQSRFGAPQPVITQTLFRGVDSTGPSLKETAAATLPAHNQDSLSSSSSFYDKLGSMSELSNWFSNIGSNK